MNRVTRINTIAIVAAVVVALWILYIFYGLFITKSPSLSNQPYPNVIWAKGLNWQGGSSHTIDDFAASQEHIYMSGTIPAVNEHVAYDGFVAKLDMKDGHMIDFRRYREKKALVIEATSISVDPKTRFLYLWTTGDAGLRLQKIDTDGKTVWSKSVKAAALLLTLRVGPNGNIYLIEEGTYPVQEPYASKNPIYARDPDGKALWKIEAYRISDVVFDKNSNLYVAGEIIDGADPYPAILSFDANGESRWTQAIQDTSDSAKLDLAIDTQKDIVNAIITTPDSQKNIWQKYSVMGELIDSQPIDVMADAVISGGGGNLYFFEEDAGQVNMQKYDRSRKLRATSSYARRLFLTQADIGVGLMASNIAEDNSEDAIFVYTESIISRLKIPD